MSTTNVIGLFVNKNMIDKISNSLELAGLAPQSFSAHDINEENLAMNVIVKDEYEHQMVHNIFDFYHSLKVFETENLDSSDIANYILAHSRAEIYETPPIRLRKPHEGINSEVHFG